MNRKTIHTAPSLKVQPAAPVAGLKRRERKAYEFDRFYRGRTWRSFRDRIMFERGYRCEWCGHVGKAQDNAMVLDHVLPVRTHEHLKLEPGNVRVLCRSCDAVRHAKDRPGSRAHRR